MSELLRIEDLKVNYGGIEAVKGISLSVKQGEIVTLIGANGAGKSTVLNTVSGLLHPRSGSVAFEEKDLKGIAPHKIVEHGLAQVPEGRRVFLQMTVEENLEMGAFTQPNSPSPPAWRTCTSGSPACWSAASRSPEPCPVVSSRCWPWAVP